MKFKFNWGTGIFIFITLFLLVNVFVIYKSFQQRNDLVEQEYYPQGLEYQKQIDRFAKANALSAKIEIREKAGELLIKYPNDLKAKSIKGQVIFFRPSDENADFSDSIRFDSAMVQRIPIQKMIKGKYIAKFFWIMDGKEYANESTFRVNK
jgi:regulatory protein YycI of two-component signal transduction system YycFG